MVYIFHRGLENQKTLETTIIYARGEKYYDGDSQRNIKAIFYWTPVTHFFGLSLSVFMCLSEMIEVRSIKFLRRYEEIII